MNVTITIPLPVLVSPQYFKVRYRDDPAHSWVDIANQTNDPFTITGLSAGIYQLSVTLVKSEDPLVECSEVITSFEVVEESPCADFAFALVANDDATLYTLEITVSSTPLTPPCGGYDVLYGIAGGTMSTVHYASMPLLVLLPASNAQYYAEVRALDCAGNYVICGSGTTGPVEGGCDHATLTHAELYADGTGWHIKLTITQSSPPTNPFTVAYWQGNVFSPGSGSNDPGGMITLAATPATTVLVFDVQPGFGFNFTGGLNQLIYNGTIADRCGWSTKWAVVYNYE